MAISVTMCVAGFVCLENLHVNKINRKAGTAGSRKTAVSESRSHLDICCLLSILHIIV